MILGRTLGQTEGHHVRSSVVYFLVTTAEKLKSYCQYHCWCCSVMNSHDFQELQIHLDLHHAHYQEC